MEQKEAFVEVIENTLRNIAEGGIDKKALQAGLNYYEFRFRGGGLSEVIRED